MTTEYDSGLERKKSLFPSISVNTLKIAGALLLTLYFFSAAVIQNGMLHVYQYSPAQLSELLAGDISGFNKYISSISLRALSRITSS